MSERESGSNSIKWLKTAVWEGTNLQNNRRKKCLTLLALPDGKGPPKVRPVLGKGDLHGVKIKAASNGVAFSKSLAVIVELKNVQFVVECTWVKLHYSYIKHFNCMLQVMWQVLNQSVCILKSKVDIENKFSWDCLKEDLVKINFIAFISKNLCTNFVLLLALGSWPKQKYILSLSRLNWPMELLLENGVPLAMMKLWVIWMDLYFKVYLVMGAHL